MRRCARMSALVLALVGCTAGRVDTGMDAGPAAVDAAGRRDGDGPARDGGRPDGSAPVDASTRDSGPIVPREVDCADGLDGDDDGDVDCEDTDCDDAACGGTRTCIDFTCGGCTGASTETMCGDHRDEDCDELTDCEDPDCDAVSCGPDGVVCADGACPCESGFEERLCGDGTDDDCDGLIDCMDPDCNGRTCGAAGEVCLSGTCQCPGAGSAEMVCDGADDNCSGVVDEGCPNGLGSCCAMNLLPVGGSGGTPWADTCPAGAALIGIAGRASTRIDRIQPICAALIFEVDDTTTPEDTFSVRRGAAIDGATHGGDTGTPFEDTCPNNEVVLGIHGAADTQLGSISLRCGAISIRRSGGFDWVLEVTPTTSTPTRGTGGMEPFMADCGERSVITGLSGRSDVRVDQLGFTCRRLELSLR